MRVEWGAPACRWVGQGQVKGRRAGGVEKNRKGRLSDLKVTFPASELILKLMTRAEGGGQILVNFVRRMQ